MTWYQSILLGIVQGLTEFLPVSSSGHLVFMPLLLKWEQQPLFFDVMMHLGTAFALLLYFRKDLTNIIKGVFTNIRSHEAKLGAFILLGSFPAALLGVLFEDRIEAVFRSGVSVAVFLLIGTVLMIAAEISAKKITEHQEVTGAKAMIIGLFQALALFPGVSRSGSTISGGMLLKLTRENAARFSFLLSIPAVLGAAVFKMAEFAVAPEIGVGILNVLPGFISSFVVGYLAIDLLLKFLKNHSLYVFIVYRFVLASLLLIIFM